MRISVKGGGCSGFQYAFDIDKTRADDDLVVDPRRRDVVVDPVSLEMMKGSELDFVDDLMGQSFKVKNPNAVASCRFRRRPCQLPCGSSSGGFRVDRWLR